jgi:FkbM family methyltransferase
MTPQQQRTVNSALRLLGAALPRAGGLEFRFTRKLSPFVPRGTAPWRAGNGFLMGATTNNADYLTGVNERLYLKALFEMLPRDGLVINAGANTGYTSLFLAQAARVAGHNLRFLAIEPEPRTFDLLQENIDLNQFPIRAVRAAAGEAPGEAMLSSTGPGDGAAALHARPKFQTTQFTVPVETIDNMLTPQDPAPVAIVLDVEGFGGPCMRGASRVLRANRPLVAVELHSAQEEQEITATMDGLGYSLALQRDDVWGLHKIFRAG